ncbi:Protein STRUBBELIG-RECEPTOR FAMILY 7 [Abeliophyllum distichum]|uniref:Protein STRUBBELIG-RECEPTOR FAMILY 7 n=1 Tax=Abeliophyllum distichum TaxID=126358 RepID=A0ABD1VP15_9LAMI
MTEEAPVVAAAALLIGILVFGLSSTNADTDPNDASALRVLYTALNSPQKLTKWSGSAGDPCGESWKGITCSGSKVTEIKISGLGLTGNMGYQLTSLTSVTTFDISNNNLGNQIPYGLPPNVQRLNLAGNGFNGGLPYSISQMPSLKYLNVSHNQIQGQLNDMFGSLSALSTLDFSFNAMTGDLPQSFRSLTNMTNMYLQNNQLTGTIDVLANLPLEILNVENNHFSGWVPEQLKSINPQIGGNSWSSGSAPPPPPGTPPASRPNRNHKSGGNSSSSDGGGSGSKSGIGAGGVAGIVISILVVGAIAAFFIIKRRSRKPSMDIEKPENQPFAPLASQEAPEMKSVQSLSMASSKTFEAPATINLKPPPIDRHKSFDEDEVSAKPIVIPKKINRVPINAKSYSVADLQIATDSFSIENLIGEGSIGRVYRAQLDDGKVLAVKKINSSILLNHEDFLDIVSEISRKPLTWNTRVKIALGTARALEYLHEVCSPSVIHKNFKSANILLDTELNPHLSDCGLASLVHEPDQASGYSAPEVTMSGQYTINSDVYSFGVVMLELLSGRKPFDSSRPRTEQSLVRWATPQLHDIDALSKMVDPALKGLYPVKSLSRFADVIALCVQPEPEFRPPMSEVVQALVRLVQRANMSKRTFGNEGPSRSDSQEGQDYTP